MKLEVKRLDKELPLPKYESDGAAGIDLYAAEDKYVTSMFPCIMPTGIAIALEPGYEAQIRPRSGLAAKHDITVVNSPGTIDSDYRGEIKVILKIQNCEFRRVEIKKGDRIAQLVVKPAPQAEIIEVNELNETIRGSKGFGSTGIN